MKKSVMGSTPVWVCGGMHCFIVLSGEKLRRFRLTEESHQALDVLGRRGQEELLSHELQSSQAQATQSDLILQFREQCFHFLSLPLCMGKLWRARQLPCALSGWFMHVDGQTAERPTRALRF